MLNLIKTHLRLTPRGLVALALLLVLATGGAATAQDSPTSGMPPMEEETAIAETPGETPGAGDEGDMTLNVNVFGGDSTGFSDVVKVMLFLSILTLIPAMILAMTSFTRIAIVLSFCRRALSLQQMPPNQIVVGLSLFLTAYIMAPVFTEINRVAIRPHVQGEITEMEALKRAVGPLRDFMLKNTRRKDLALFINTARMPRPRTAADVPTHIILPAFVLSEIKTAFQMGFLIFLPMLVIDMVVATLLTSMGMFMLPPVMVSVPVKILLFVLVDGWNLVIGSLTKSFA